MIFHRERSRRGRFAGVLLIAGAWFGFTVFGVAVGLLPQRDGGEEEHHGNVNCTGRTLDEFPGDFMTDEQRAHGGVAAHILVALYTFSAIAIVCDDYFVPSLEKICEVLELQPDVAGATFMAAGSSAPELFTAIIGVLFAKSDVGVSAIVGSAVFNILFIPAMCGLFSGMVIYLTWWPMFRDSMFYIMSVILLVVVINDATVHWYEAAAMLTLYLFYVLLMFVNPKLGGWATHKVAEWRKKRQTETPVEAKEKGEIEELNPNPEGEEGVRNILLVLDEEAEGEYVSPLMPPDGILKKIYWALMLPVTLVLVITIPDVRRPGCWEKLYAASFILSIVWIAIMSYIMVWMVCTVGDTLGIPDTVMGLTVLAAGTSVPDAMASLFVSRDGFGDMAMSNSIGSNVFDILLCLGLPWLIHTVMIDPDNPAIINSSGLTFSAVTLLATVIFLVASMLINGWKLNKKLGVICLVVYAVVITFCCLYELNVFGVMNPPSCRSLEHHGSVFTTLFPTTNSMTTA